MNRKFKKQQHLFQNYCTRDIFHVYCINWFVKYLYSRHITARCSFCTCGYVLSRSFILSQTDMDSPCTAYFCSL